MHFFLFRVYTWDISFYRHNLHWVHQWWLTACGLGLTEVVFL